MKCVSKAQAKNRLPPDPWRLRVDKPPADRNNYFEQHHPPGPAIPHSKPLDNDLQPLYSRRTALQPRSHIRRPPILTTAPTKSFLLEHKKQQRHNLANGSISLVLTQQPSSSDLDIRRPALQRWSHTRAETRVCVACCRQKLLCCGNGAQGPQLHKGKAGSCRARGRRVSELVVGDFGRGRS